MADHAEKDVYCAPKWFYLCQCQFLIAESTGKKVPDFWCDSGICANAHAKHIAHAHRRLHMANGHRIKTACCVVNDRAVFPTRQALTKASAVATSKTSRRRKRLRTMNANGGDLSQTWRHAPLPHPASARLILLSAVHGAQRSWRTRDVDRT